MSEYLRFDDLFSTGKTRIVAVVSAKHGFQLGQIRWYGRWRQYVLFPDEATVFNPECLREIAEYIRSMMKERQLVKAFKAMNAHDERDGGSAEVPR